VIERGDVGSVRSRALTGVAVGCGAAALLLRIALIGAPGAAVVFAGILVGLAAVSIATPVPDETPRSSAATALCVGVATVLAASALFANGIHLPHGPLAIVLGVGAALSEELFFRRLVYGTLAAWHPAVAVVGSAAVFALVHVPLYGPPVFWVDLGAGLLLSWQRWASGDWRASAATHAVANVLAVVR
jgi:membrane protease YdiL (CAAX protease family)